MKKYIYPTLTVLGLALGIFIDGSETGPALGIYPQERPGDGQF